MYKPLQWKIWMVLFLWLVSCSPAAPASTPTPRLTTPHTQIPALEDEELTEAMHQAQETLHIWRKEFLAPKQAYSMTSLKIRFASRGEVEDIWTEPMFVVDNVYTVRMVEGVTLVQGIHPERLVDVKPQNIVDWMLLAEDGTVIGGYTLRLEYKRLNPEEQKKYLEATGYKFE
jgi:uncharacterized protein YegJ (DUF2314 family)